MTASAAPTSAGLPPVVSLPEWEAARVKLLIREKEATRALDRLAAERRRLPMVAIEEDYRFEGPHGAATLLDLFEGRRQLVVYHFMLAPGSAPCVGCSSFTDNVPNLAHLRARDTNLVLISRAPIAEIGAVRERMGWTVPWYSSCDSPFNYDFGVSTERGEAFGISVFLRDDERVFRTYFTSARGSDRLRMDFNLLDLTPFGRQEEWEDSPAGWPQTPPYSWWRLHDEY